jgi:hypothetical protein
VADLKVARVVELLPDVRQNVPAPAIRNNASEKISAEFNTQEPVQASCRMLENSFERNGD